MAPAWPDDPTPLTRVQLRALAAGTARELTWGLHVVRRELNDWLALAERIPDAPIRDDALCSLRHKRSHSFGAALFLVLLVRRDRTLMRLLVAWQTMLDYLDNVHERHPIPANGRMLHLATVEALDPGRPLSDYYSLHPWKDDGGYLQALVETCRACCLALPSYEQVRPYLVAETERYDVLALNHLADPAERDPALRSWAAEHFPHERELHWYEITAAASSSMMIFPLLSLGARPSLSDDEVAATHAAYWPWVPLANIMLDAYNDQAEDAAHSGHNYVTHYSDAIHTSERLAQIVFEATAAVMALPDGHRHAVIVACMVALYLSKDTSRGAAMDAGRRQILDAGGSLTRLLLPVLRVWRIAYA